MTLIHVLGYAEPDNWIVEIRCIGFALLATKATAGDLGTHIGDLLAQELVEHASREEQLV